MEAGGLFGAGGAGDKSAHQEIVLTPYVRDLGQILPSPISSVPNCNSARWMDLGSLPAPASQVPRMGPQTPLWNPKGCV